MPFSKRNLVRIVSFFTAFIVTVVGFIAVTNNKIKHLETQTAYGYSMNLNELDGSLYNISVALQKCLYASSATQLSSLAAELCTESTVAKNSLSQLPYTGEELTAVNKLLSQVGDYALFLSKKVIQGDSVSDDDRENLHKLSMAAQSVSNTVNSVRIEYDKDGVWTQSMASGIGESIDSDFSSGLESLEELLVDYPSLVYDGPFSDHMLNGNMKMLSDADELTSKEAFEHGIKILGIGGEGFNEETETLGNVPCYNFSDGKITFSVTKRGGYIIYMRKYTDIAEQKISYEQAVAIAQEYLNRNSGANFVTTYYFADEGVCTVNLAYKEGATICYPDLIKVGVALDTGEVVLVEAGGYLANHHVRTISTPKYSVAEAENRLSDALQVSAVRRAIIPTDGNTEKHCYEFSCIGIEGEELLVYVNVENLEEEKILMLLKTDGGTLTK